MNKIFKIIFIVFLVIILSFALLIGYLYINHKLSERRMIKFTYCEADEECVLVKNYGVCACGSDSVNKIYENEYTTSMTKNSEKNSKSKLVQTCQLCRLPVNEVPKCIKNKCYAYSDNKRELILLNMT